MRSRDSSGSIVSDYGLDDRAIGARLSTGAKDFSSNLCAKTDSEAHPASCTMGTESPFPGVKRSRGVTLTTHLHLVLRSRMSRSNTSSLSKLHRGVYWDFFTSVFVQNIKFLSDLFDKQN
jgi:hypothetical protein